jgi:hypothetical protein
MRLSQIPLLFMLSCVPSTAREQAMMLQEQAMDVGGGVICDTAQQVERFVALQSDGKEADAR